MNFPLVWWKLLILQPSRASQAPAFSPARQGGVPKFKVLWIRDPAVRCYIGAVGLGKMVAQALACEGQDSACPSETKASRGLKPVLQGLVAAIPRFALGLVLVAVPFAATAQAQSNACQPEKTRKGRPAPPGPSAWNGWADAANTRFQPALPAGLTARTVPKLRLAWAFGFPEVTTGFGAPTVFNGTIFVGAADGSVYALDAQRGSTCWAFKAAAGVRAAPAVGNGRVYIGDLKGNVYALDDSTGAQLWKVRADDHPMAVITGSPKFDSGRLYVPVSGRDEAMAAATASFECCTFRGSVVALDAASGHTIWKTYTIAQQAKITGQNAKGAKTWGPSGAVPWSSPTLDLQKKALYIATGVNYSNPPTDTSDAIIAIDLNSGRILWTRQTTAHDSYNFACPSQDKTNCPTNPFIDADFGNSGMLAPLGDGGRILVASDKSGMVYGLDPDQQGEIIWKRKIAAGGVNGGTMWGGAVDERGVAYIGISDFSAGHPETGGGLVALQIATGDKMWTTPAPRPSCIAVQGCSAAQPAPVSVIPGVAFLGSWDGHIRAYATNGGAIIWDYDTAHEFETVNGVKAHGGSINSMGPVIAGGMLYITSGYSGPGMPGNVLLAFSVDGR